MRFRNGLIRSQHKRNEPLLVVFASAFMTFNPTRATAVSAEAEKEATFRRAKRRARTAPRLRRNNARRVQENSNGGYQVSYRSKARIILRRKAAHSLVG